MNPPSNNEIAKAALLYSIERSVHEKSLSARECMLLTGLSSEVASNVSHQQRVRRFHKKFDLHNVIGNAIHRHEIHTPVYLQFHDYDMVKAALVRRLVTHWTCRDCMLHAGVFDSVTREAAMRNIVRQYARRFRDDHDMLQSVYHDIKDGKKLYSSVRRNYSSARIPAGRSNNDTEYEQMFQRLRL